MTAEQPPCPRCYSELPLVRPWGGFRVLRVLWFAGLCILVLFSPIIATDLFVMIPLSVVFLLGGGPILGFARQVPSCAACGLERPHPGWHETPCRPVRAASPAPAPPLAVSEEESATDETSGVHPRPMPKS